MFMQRLSEIVLPGIFLKLYPKSGSNARPFGTPHCLFLALFFGVGGLNKGKNAHRDADRVQTIQSTVSVLNRQIEQFDQKVDEIAKQ